MDATRFPRIAQTFRAPTSRRRALLALALGGLTLARQTAEGEARKKRGKRRKRKMHDVEDLQQHA